MNGYLLDTHVVLFAAEAPERLAEASKAALLEGPNWLSVLSGWEIAIKVMRSRLKVPNPRGWWEESLRALGARPLPWRAEHLACLWDLPPLHQDPFDRALMAQAIAEDLTLVTQDRGLAAYAAAGCRVLG